MTGGVPEPENRPETRGNTRKSGPQTPPLPSPTPAPVPFSLRWRASVGRRQTLNCRSAHGLGARCAVTASPLWCCSDSRETVPGSSRPVRTLRRMVWAACGSPTGSRFPVTEQCAETPPADAYGHSEPTPAAAHHRHQAPCRHTKDQTNHSSPRQGTIPGTQHDGRSQLRNDEQEAPCCTLRDASGIHGTVHRGKAFR